MSDALSQVEAILPQLSSSERILLIQKLNEEMGTHPGSGIDIQPGVCGGEARIIRTRIPVWLLVQARNLGKTDTQLLAAYPSLRPDDLTNAWTYAARHEAEIEAQIKENESA
ncbi:DUF433 domain-containing protein [Aeoliella mucimassa]|uniref:DUF433 domain-containing protein n=1 Tax=Aeoliella mucimassa TaxID=2527972 RepID=A0A518AIL0_9BACT|nr:DUF433 domain-containing protein [Aeoliella mucimassa]QDU54573.1 hypothetical protein Pan181_07560 [Aeoliella mucimassa]